MVTIPATNPDLPTASLVSSNASWRIRNGITAGFDDEQDIAFNPIKAKDDMSKTGVGANNDSSWRGT
ncbi:hypothetical protein O9992_05770 [Vibrio lentus]|nr:hypothetical protein [Vibrio lentus]